MSVLLESQSGRVGSYSLWLWVPLGLAGHSKVLVRLEGHDGTGGLGCDGGRLLDWRSHARTDHEPMRTSQVGCQVGMRTMMK